MSMSRRALAAMGIEPEKIDQIVEMNAESINGLKDENASLKEKLAEAEKYQKDAKKLETVQKELDELKKQNEADAKEREGKDYDKLKQEFDDYKAQIAAKETRQAKEAAYKEILKDAGIPERHFAKILKYSDVDGVELDENGKIKSQKELMKSVKEEWSDHIEQKTVQGASTAKPPANQGTGGMKREDIYKRDEKGRFILSAEERQKAISENLSQFNNVV